MNIIKHENHYLAALNTKLIVDMNQKEVQSDIIKILSKTYLDSGKIIDTKELLSLSGGVLNEVKRYFPNLKVGELDLCFQNGVRGQYGENFGLNIVTFHKWIKAYLNEEKRAEALKIKNTPQREPKKEYTEADKLRIREDFIQYAKSTYQKTGLFGSFQASINDIYKILVETGEILADEHLTLIDEAYDVVLEDLEQRMKTNDLMLRRKLTAQKETLTKDSKEVLTMAKQITIEDLWNN